MLPGRCSETPIGRSLKWLLRAIASAFRGAETPGKEADMAIQEQERRRTHHHEDAPRDVEEAQASSAASSAGLKHDLDDILDEIDEILEENAEEFVKGYVQKGGQ